MTGPAPGGVPEHPDDDGAGCAGRLQRIALLHEMGQYERVVEEAVAELEHSMEDFKRARARVNEALSLEPDHAGALAPQAELASSTRE